MRYVMLVGYFVIYGALLWVLHVGLKEEWQHFIVVVLALAMGIVVTILFDWRTKKIFRQYRDTQSFLTQVLEASPSSVVVVGSGGSIRYVNPITEKVLGSNKTAGKNILNFSTVKDTMLENAIVGAFEGRQSELLGYTHVSATTGELKHLNVYVKPIRLDRGSGNQGALIIVHDVSRENNLLEKLEKNYLHTFRGFAKVVDARDSYTGSHSANVNEWVVKMLGKMELDSEEMQDIHIASMLHDIGKVGIPDSVLNKEGPLTDEEFEIMKSHPAKGADLLAELEVFHKVHRIIRHHHERWDGKGYPSGLCKEQIPLGARIIAIADTYDAIASDRVYRKARSPEEALAILRQEKNRQFDGRLVDIFEQVLRENHVIVLESES